MSGSYFDMWALTCNEKGGYNGCNGVVEVIYKLKSVIFCA